MNVPETRDIADTKTVEVVEKISLSQATDRQTEDKSLIFVIL